MKNLLLSILALVILTLTGCDVPPKATEFNEFKVIEKSLIQSNGFKYWYKIQFSDKSYRGDTSYFINVKSNKEFKVGSTLEMVEITE